MYRRLHRLIVIVLYTKQGPFASKIFRCIDGKTVKAVTVRQRRLKLFYLEACERNDDESIDCRLLWLNLADITAHGMNSKLPRRIHTCKPYLSGRRDESKSNVTHKRLVICGKWNGVEFWHDTYTRVFSMRIAF